jgi:hypothetical protein
VIVTGFRDPAHNRLVVVAVNTQETEQLLKIRVQGASPRSGTTGEVSYGTKRWDSVTGIGSTAQGELLYVTPARSVVTLAIPIN